eukprot:IDg15447t1
MAQGMGILEMSHRDADGPVQSAIAGSADKLRQLLSVPSNYHIIFMQCGAHGQFAAVPLNFLGSKLEADYISSGFWSVRAAAEAAKYCEVRFAYDGKSNGYSHIPPVEQQPPLVADFTSTLLSRPVDLTKYGCIYASGGKNLGPAGVTVVIVREDLVGLESNACPSVLSYSKMVHSKPIPSIYNTPPTFLIYMMNLVLTDNVAFGGLEALRARSVARADAMYRLMEEFRWLLSP